MPNSNESNSALFTKNLIFSPKNRHFFKKSEEKFRIYPPDDSASPSRSKVTFDLILYRLMV
jgi:hypothetical protein